MKGYSTFPKSPALLGPYHQILYHLISRTLIGGVLLLCREPVGVFYSPSQLGKEELEVKAKPSYMCTFTTPPHESLSCLVSLYFSFLPLSHTPTHTLLLQNVSLCEGEDGESRSVPSRSEDAQRRTGSFWMPALKTNCDKVSVCNESVKIGPGMLDYLLRSAPTYRKRILTSEKKVRQWLILSFYLLFLLLVSMEVLGFCPSSFDVELSHFDLSLEGLWPV